MKKLSLLICALFGLINIFYSFSALSQEFPQKPIRLIVPFAPGGNADINARIYGTELQKVLGQPVIIESKAGAGGLIGNEFASKADPDGYTLFFTSNGPLIYAPVINKKPQLDWKKNFLPVSSVSFTPMALQVDAKLPITNVKDLIAAIKANPNGFTLGTSGSGGINHLESEMLQKQFGVNWLTVHYRGTGPAITDLLGGQIQLTVDQVSVVQKYVKDGSTRAIAVMAAKRTPWLPNVPTLREQGFIGVDDIQTFTGVFAPMGTPTKTINILSEASQKVLSNPEVIKKFYDAGVQATWMSPKEFNNYLQKEDATWIPIVRQMNITSD
jgi:tripartite-type tricarboxylate transporter receptor subunit TctC